MTMVLGGVLVTMNASLQVVFPLPPCFPCLVRAQEQIKGKLDLRPVSRYDVQLLPRPASSAISRAKTRASPGILRGAQGSLLYNYSITAAASATSIGSSRFSFDQPIVLALGHAVGLAQQQPHGVALCVSVRERPVVVSLEGGRERLISHARVVFCGPVGAAWLGWDGGRKGGRERGREGGREGGVD